MSFTRLRMISLLIHWSLTVGLGNALTPRGVYRYQAVRQIEEEVIDGVDVGGGRSLMAKATVFNETMLRALGVPEDAELLVQSATSCGDSTPVVAMAARAVLCTFVLETRRCMGITEYGVWLKGRGCRGRNCLLGVDAENSKCFMEAFGLDVDSEDASRDATCGLGPGAEWLLQPTQVNHDSPVGGNPNCLSVTPPGSVAYQFAECDKGRLLYRVNVTFDDPISELDYACHLAPGCGGADSVTARFVCYTERRTLAKHNNGTYAVGTVNNPENGQGGAWVLCVSCMGYLLSFWLVLSCIIGPGHVCLSF